MARIFTGILILILTAALAGQAQPAASAPELQPAGSQQKPDPKPGVDVTGKWQMTLEMSMGTANPSLELKQNGEKLTGSYTGRYGTFALQGTIKERSIIFSFQMAAEGESVAMTFTGEVAPDAQSIKGKAVLGEMGDATWSAKRDKTH